MKSTERERCLSTISCNSGDRRRRPGGRVRTRQRVSDVFQLIGASRRCRQPHFRINNLMNGKPAWELIPCNGFTLMRPRAKMSFKFLIYIDIFFPSIFEKTKLRTLCFSNLMLCWRVHEGGANTWQRVWSPTDVAVRAFCTRSELKRRKGRPSLPLFSPLCLPAVHFPSLISTFSDSFLPANNRSGLRCQREGVSEFLTQFSADRRTFFPPV